jgi:hypothetical protein
MTGRRAQGKGQGPNVMNTKIYRVRKSKVTGERQVRFEPRVRFNWGYWDGRQDLALGRRNARALDGTHHDPTYAAGYRAGVDDAKAGVVTETSEPAWVARQGGAR